MRQILLYLFIIFACSVSAETLKITGRVVDSHNEPCIGATVEVVGTDCHTATDGGTDRYTATDGDGNFSIEVEKGEILKFSYIGYYEKVVEVMNDSPLVIELKEQIEFCRYCSPYIFIPENQLKNSLQTIQILYPKLKKCKEKGNLITYEEELCDWKFYIYNGIVCKQYYSFFECKEHLRSVYHDIAGFFEGYDSCVESKSGNEITFYYPEYSVHIKYEHRKNRVSLTYELYPEYYK